MGMQVVYLGDELCAAGFRLAGVSTRVPPMGEEAAWLSLAMREAKMVLLGPRVAARLAPEELEHALSSVSPMVMVMPEFDGRLSGSDPAYRIRQLLGVQA